MTVPLEARAIAASLIKRRHKKNISFFSVDVDTGVSNDRYQNNNNNNLTNVVKVNNSEQLKDFIVSFLEENSPPEASSSNADIINLERSQFTTNDYWRNEDYETETPQMNYNDKEISLVESKALSKLDQIRAKLSSFLQASQNDTSQPKGFIDDIENAGVDKSKMRQAMDSSEYDDDMIASYGDGDGLQQQEETQIVEVIHLEITKNSTTFKLN